MLGILLVAGVVGVLIASVAHAKRVERQRTEAMRAAAERMGWSFAAQADSTVIPGMERFELFSWGHSRSIRNLSRARRGDRQITLFDYRYVTGGGKSQQTWDQTVVHVRSPRLRLPRFALRAENLFHKIGGLFGYRDIDLDSDPVFSTDYLLRGEDEAAIRALFGRGVLEFYHRNPRCCTEGAESELFFWRTSHRVAPEDLPSLVDLALSLVDRFEAGSVS